MKHFYECLVKLPVVVDDLMCDISERRGDVRSPESCIYFETVAIHCLIGHIQLVLAG